MAKSKLPFAAPLGPPNPVSGQDASHHQLGSRSVVFWPIRKGNSLQRGAMWRGTCHPLKTYNLKIAGKPDGVF